MLQALRIRDFALLWSGGLISNLGTWLLTIAIPAHVYIATGSLQATGLTVAAEYVPILVLGPVAGVLADRWDRRRLMIGTNVFCAAAVAVMLLGLGSGQYWVLYGALIAENSGTVLYVPAWQARVPAIVGTGEELSSANALNSASSGTVRLIGGPLGGMLFALVGVRWLIGADAASYLAGALAIAATSRSPAGSLLPGSAPAAPARRDGTQAAPARPDGAPASSPSLLRQVTRDLTVGLRILRGQPVARALLPVSVLFLGANAALSAILIPFAVGRLGGSAHAGILLSGLGIGFLIGAPVIRALLDRVQPRYLLSASLAGTAAGFLALFTSSSLATALPAIAVVGLFGCMALVTPQTTLQRVIPNAALGRVSAIFLTCAAAATLLGAVTGPFVAQAAQITALAIAASCLTLAAAALALVRVPMLPAVAKLRAGLQNQS